MTSMSDFLDPYAHGFARVAVAVPRNRVADPAFNARETVTLYREASVQGAVVVFPELGLSAYTCDDLFHQAALLDGCEAALATVVAASKQVGALAIVGLPLRVDHRLYNCAVAVSGGRVIAAWPKTYLPNYGEFYEARQFGAADSALAIEIDLCGQRVPFGTDVVAQASQLPLLKVHVDGLRRCAQLRHPDRLPAPAHQGRGTQDLPDPGQPAGAPQQAREGVACRA
jgi:NAD+ synthase (glutamine-hydrolysing)